MKSGECKPTLSSGSLAWEKAIMKPQLTCKERRGCKGSSKWNQAIWRDKGKKQDKLVWRKMTWAKLTDWENGLCCRATYPAVADLGRSQSKMCAFINSLLLMTAATAEILLLRTLISVLFLFFLNPGFLRIPRMHVCLKLKLSYT